MATVPAPHERAREVTMTEAATLLGLTYERLRQFAHEEPDLPSVGRGRRRLFLWPALRKWRDAQLRKEGVHSVRPVSLDEARQRKLAAEADLAEMERDERRGQLVPVALYRQEYEGACSRIRAALLNAPARYAPQLLEALVEWLPAAALRRAEPFLARVMGEIMAELEAGDDVPADDAA